MVSRKNLFIGLTLLIVVIALMAIASFFPQMGNRYSNISSNADMMFAPTQAAFAREGPPAAADDTLVSQEGAGDASIPANQRIILKNASLSITVEDPLATIDQIAEMAEEMGGWVVASSTSAFKNTAGEDATRGNITIRVPAERLNEALDRIKSGAGRLDSESITGQDVTQEYVDLSSRLANLQTAEDQLQSIMASATKVEDVLAVQRELTNVRSEIEHIEGRLKYFNEAAAYSAIAVTVNPFPPSPVQSQSASWNPLTTAESAISTLIQIGQFLADAVITLVIVGAPLLLAGVIVVWAIRRSRRRVTT